MRVLIVGAGIAGHTLALCLQRRGDQAVVVERAPSLPTGGYMIDFFGSGYDACDRLGLREELERIHYPVERLAFLARGAASNSASRIPLCARGSSTTGTSTSSGAISCAFSTTR